MIDIPKEDLELLIALSNKKNISYEIVLKLVDETVKIRYQDKVMGFIDEISNIIKKFANQDEKT